MQTLMKNYTALFLFICLLILTSCKTMKHKRAGNTKLDFIELKTGQYSGLDNRKEIVINDSSAFCELWNQMFSIYHPLPGLPEIDFMNYTLVGLSIGTRSTGGHSVEIVEILDTPEKVEIIYKISSPAADDYVTMALTQPYHMVLIPKTSKEITFRPFPSKDH